MPASTSSLDQPDWAKKGPPAPSPVSALSSSKTPESTPEKTSTIDDFLRQAQSDDAEYKKQAAPLMDRMGKIADKIGAVEVPKAPTMIPVPKPDYKSPLEAYGSAASWIATFGSLLTREPLTNALNASAAVMNAQREGDMQKFNDSMKIWEAETKNASEMHKYELDSYNAVIAKYGAESDLTAKELQVLASSFKNNTASQMAAVREMSYFTNMQDKQQKIDAMNVKFDTFNQWKTENPDATPDQTNKKYQEIFNSAKVAPGSNLTPDAIESSVDRLIAGDKSALMNMGKGAQGSENLAAIQNRLAEKMKEKGMSGEDIAQKMADFEGLKAKSRTIGSMVGAGTVAAEAVGGAGKLAIEASKNYPRSEFPPLNDILNATAESTGDPAIVDFELKNQTLINEFARARNPKGIPRIADKEEAGKILRTGFNEGQYETAVHAIGQETKNLLDSANRAFNHGKKEEDIPQNDIDLLKKTPDDQHKKFFDDVYGKGAADRILGEKKSENSGDDGYYEKLAKVETGSDPTQKNPKSSAEGKYQFIKANRDKYGIDGPDDQERAVRELTADNKKALEKTLGREPSHEELYLAHQQGALGARLLLKNPGKNAIEALTTAYRGDVRKATKAVIDNGGTLDMTAKEFAEHVMRTFEV